jgi:hypothetical protein
MAYKQIWIQAKNFPIQINISSAGCFVVIFSNFNLISSLVK